MSPANKRLVVNLLRHHRPQVERRADPSLARRKVELLAEFDVVESYLADILAVIDLHRLDGFS